MNSSIDTTIEQHHITTIKYTDVKKENCQLKATTMASRKETRASLSILQTIRLKSRGTRAKKSIHTSYLHGIKIRNRPRPNESIPKYQIFNRYSMLNHSIDNTHNSCRRRRWTKGVSTCCYWSRCR